VLAAAGAVGALLVPVLGVASVAGLVVRWRRSDALQRERLRLVALSAVPLAVAVVWSSAAPSAAATAAVVLAVLGWAVCVASAAVQHRLFDVDVAVSRTVVLVAVAAALLGLHVASVALLGGVAGAPLLATAMVAVLFAPLRELLQRRVNAFLFGRSEDPWTSLVLVGRRAEAAGDAQAALEDVGDVVLASLRLASVQVLLADGDDDVVVTTRGAAPVSTERCIDQPLVHLGVRVGVLRVAPRLGEALGRRDHALLADLAPAVAAVGATVLAGERLQRSQQHLVTAVEEERRRLRRDLHDGVGPALTGVAFALEAACNVRATDPDAADVLLASATGDLHDAVADLRHAVEGLRPAALDDLGLVPALEQRLRALESSSAVTLSLDVPAPLPPLAAAVEVAAYRIALEGVANALRHAHATRCDVRLEVSGDALKVHVRDDGRGLPQPLRLGAGLLSVRERATALGGRAEARREAPGSALDVVLPLEPA
jgi:signal transduction histidine kinase